jgi:NAD(P)-dependent dehydrogenase (short-subunit alcohol dehydrogenase family)
MGQGRLENRVVLVTGAGRGIGAAIARLCAAEGARVVVNDRDPEPAAEVVAQIEAAGGTAVAAVGDLADWTAAGVVVDTAVEELGALDGVVNNAGTFSMALPHEQDPTELRRLLEVNVLGVAHVGIHALRHMVPRGRGSIVNVTSSSMAGLPAMSAYGATKGAVTSLTLGWALDLEGTGVRVNALSPIATTRLQEVRMDFEGLAGDDRETTRETRFVAPEFNAPMAVFLLSDRAAHLSGQVVQVSRGDQLGLLARPALAGPTVTVRPGSVDDVERAFGSTLDAQAQPHELSGRR